MTDKKQVAKKENTELVTPPQAPRGFEDAKESDLILPRVELLQGLSSAVTEGKGKVGEIVNQISKEPLPTNVFMPIAMKRQYIKWFPRAEGGGIEYQTNDPQDPRVREDSRWGADGEKPTCTEYMNYIILLEGSRLPLVLSFCMTNLTVGKKLLTLGRMKTVQKDMWGYKYELLSKTKTNNKGTFYVYDIQESTNEVTAEEMIIGEQLYNSFATREASFAEEKPELSRATEEY